MGARRVKVQSSRPRVVLVVSRGVAKAGFASSSVGFCLAVFA